MSEAISLLNLISLPDQAQTSKFGTPGIKVSGHVMKLQEAFGTCWLPQPSGDFVYIVALAWQQM